MLSACLRFVQLDLVDLVDLGVLAVVAALVGVVVGVDGPAFLAESFLIFW